MKANLNTLRFYSKLTLNTNLPKSKNTVIQPNEQLDVFVKELIKNLKNASSTTEADKILIEMSQQGNGLKKIDPVNFKYNDYNILTTLKYYGEPLVKNLEKLNELSLSIVPELVAVLEKDNGLYIVTKNPGTKEGILKRYSQILSDDVTKEAKMQAYNDMKKLTEEGLIDDNVYRGKYWYCTNENKILIPIWKNMRYLHSNESKKDIMDRYYRIIFGI